jgi:hypothetical protein
MRVEINAINLNWNKMMESYIKMNNITIMILTHLLRMHKMMISLLWSPTMMMIIAKMIIFMIRLMNSTMISMNSNIIEKKKV